MACEDLLQRLMGDPNPCVGDVSEDKFRILIEAYTDLPSLPVIFDGIGEKIIEELVEFIFDPGDLYWFWREVELPGGFDVPSPRVRRWSMKIRMTLTRSIGSNIQDSFCIPSSAKIQKVVNVLSQFQKVFVRYF